MLSEYLRAGDGMIEIQYWDSLDQSYHSYITEGEMLFDEVMGRVQEMLDEMPPGAKVYITSGATMRLVEMADQLEDYLIPDVVFVTPTEIVQGKLRGHLGGLIITDNWLMSDHTKQIVLDEQREMKKFLDEYMDQYTCEWRAG